MSRIDVRYAGAFNFHPTSRRTLQQNGRYSLREMALTIHLGGTVPCANRCNMPPHVLA